MGREEISQYSKSINHKRKNDKLDINIYNFCSSIDIIKKKNRQATDYNKIITEHIFGKGLVSRIY